MATVITTLGKTKTLTPHTKTILKISNNSNIKSIIRLEPSILDVFIEDNANLVEINLGRRGLRNLHIINNPLLTSVQALPITQSVIIKDNPLVNYDTLNAEFMKFPTIVSYMPHVEIVKSINKCDSTLDIANATFTNNAENRQTEQFSNTQSNNTFIIHNEFYNGKAYPIITIPKGMMLYTYTYLHDTNDTLSNIYNIDSYHNYESELKFFYSVPYGARFGIDGKYNHCHIVVLTDDIRLLCMISPAPQNMDTFMYPERNPVNTPSCIYYDKNISFPCENYEHDLCLQIEFRVAMNLQGYINIDVDDSMSKARLVPSRCANGTNWKEAYGNVVYYDIIKEYLIGSCISSAISTDSNYSYINKIYSINTPANTVFGLPQIALCPLKTTVFDKPRKYQTFMKKAQRMKYVFNNYNYYLIDTCLIEDIEPTLEKFKADIIQNKQYPLFYMLNTHRNPSYMHWKSVGNTTLEDFDYLHTYNNNEVGCVFESVAFNTKLDGGTRKTLSKRKNKTRKQLRTKTICPFIFTHFLI